MMKSTTNNPESVFAELLAKGGRPARQRNLRAIHELCQAQYNAGARDFSISTIGKLCEERGILKARGLYNAPLADYRALIEAWGTYAGPSIVKPAKTLASDDYLLRIEDPAIRALVQGVIAERNKLKAQLNTLKANTTIVVDRRPAPVPSQSAAFVPFTDSERNALLKAVSLEFLDEQRWREAELGEIVNARGRTVFDPGFATAIRKALKG